MKNIQNQDIHDSFRFLVFKFFFCLIQLSSTWFPRLNQATPGWRDIGGEAAMSQEFGTAVEA